MGAIATGDSQVSTPTTTRQRTHSTFKPAHVLGNSIGNWLQTRQGETGAILTDNGGISPTDHYAHAFAALTFTLMAEAEGDSHFWSSAAKALRFTLSIPEPERKIQEFDSLALLLMAHTVRNSRSAPGRISSLLEDAIHEPNFLYDGRRLVSNNWMAMRAVCHLLHAELTGDSDSQLRGEELLQQTVTWQLEDGVFIDFPAAPRSEWATPLTYHAKICSMLTLALRLPLTLDERLTNKIGLALQRGLNALDSVSSPGGECLYYGRSCNSLFGLVAANFAFQYGPDPLSYRSFETSREAIIRLLESRLCEDGRLRLVPDKAPDSRDGWDIYYHSEVYNAYAAAFLLLDLPSARDQHKGQVDAIEIRESQTVHLDKAGLLTVRSKEFFAAFSTRGQCVLDGSSLFCDMRYSAMQPLLIEAGQRAQVPEPPLWWDGPSTKHLAVAPENIGFTPAIAWRGTQYCSRVLIDVSVVSEDGATVIHGNGHAVALSLPARPIRLIRRLRGKLTGHGDFSFTADTLSGIEIVRVVMIIPESGIVAFIDGYSGNLPTGADWVPGSIRMLPAEAMQILFPDSSELSPLSGGAPTSRGRADILSSVNTRPIAPGLQSAAMVGLPDAIGSEIEFDSSQVSIRVKDVVWTYNLNTRKLVRA